MPAKSRAGSAYLLVLVAVLVTVAIGVSGSMVHKSRRDRLARAWEIERARAISQSGIELAVAYIQSDSSWRTLRGLGEWMRDQPLLGGTVTVTAVDPDGSAIDDYMDDITIVSEGSFGRARQTASVTLTPLAVPMDCLTYASSSVGNTGFEKVITANAPIASNGSMAASGATVNANVYAASSILGLTFRQSKFPNSGTRQHPDSATVFDWYVANGTVINRSLLPGGDIDKVVLGPNSNPYGTPNARGIYVIDCAGNQIKIRDSRIEGTLVLLNPKSDSTIENTINWKPAVATLPALLIKGSITIKPDDKVLSESSQKVNFNPPAAPYNGVSDSDQLDTYPTQISGLVYASGQITVENTVKLYGQIVSGAAIVFKKDVVTITRDSTYYDNPPPGFVVRYNMLMKTDSLARVVDD